MSALNFADTIIAKLNSAIGAKGENYTSSTPRIANTAIAEGITEYLLANTTISITYSGIIPSTPPVTDPVVSDVESITGQCTPPEGTEFDNWVSSLERNIVTGFFIGPGKLGITSIVPTNCFRSGLNLSRESIKSVHLGSINDPQRAVWVEICSRILLWLNSSNIGGYTAKNILSGSTGSAVVVKTTVL